jgi:CBS-domain-containing membrane protein
MKSNPPVETPSLRDGLRVRDLMTRDVISVKADTSVARIAQLMDGKAISGMPVVDDALRVIGIVTDFDLVVRNTPIDPPPFLPLLEGRIPLETQGHFDRRIRHMVGTEARDVMTEEVLTIGPDEDVEALAELMVKKGVHLVPVVEDGRLKGVVSRADVVRWMTRDHWPAAPGTAV